MVVLILSGCHVVYINKGRKKGEYLRFVSLAKVSYNQMQTGFGYLYSLDSRHTSVNMYLSVVRKLVFANLEITL